MFMRSLAMTLALLTAVPAVAQPRTDILTGEPVRPSTGRARPDPEIFNAPHAPRQEPARNPPMEIYVAPQIGSGMGYQGGGGTGGSFQRRPVQPRHRFDDPPPPRRWQERP